MFGFGLVILALLSLIACKKMLLKQQKDQDLILFSIDQKTGSWSEHFNFVFLVGLFAISFYVISIFLKL